MRPHETLLLLLLLLLPTNQAIAATGGPSTTVTADSQSNGRKSWGLDVDTFLNLFSGNVDKLSTGIDLAHYNKFGDTALHAKGNYAYGRSKGARDQNQALALLRGDYILNSTWRFFAFTTHSFNEFKKIDYRATLGAGPWLNYESDRFRDGLSLAIMYEYSILDGFPIERVGRLSLRNLLEVQIHESAKFGSDFFYIPALSDFGDYHISVSAFIENLLYKDTFGAKFALVYNRDSRPLSGVKEDDLALKFALSFHLGE